MVASVARRLTLVETMKQERFMDDVAKLAFATSDHSTIDQHFGSAESIVIYKVTPEDAVFSEIIVFDTAEHDGNEDKLKSRIAAVEDCAVVYCRAIGGSAVMQLDALGIQPAKVSPGTTIRGQIALLQTQMRKDPVLWLLLKNRGGKPAEKPASRFDDMERSGWVE
ncbi:hypothetical protein TM49_15640 [Martelella endophytica]|uniref:Dinitrogenase iron-molybdenum cofactor biosynthesis domain-containing protein n=2 Tax=Martelella endophytica TaxID=1486262 RepID=A0A0D5LRL0_MAREN|nr:hypothetical protein TM49_15640 [Martelella endophytica]